MKTISLSEKAYERLKRLKKNDKSFSDVIPRLTETSKKDFTNLIGADVKVSREEIKENREKRKGRQRT